MPANAFCSPGVQLNVALIRCLISAKHRENRNYIREQHKNRQNNSKRYQNLKNEDTLKKILAFVPCCGIYHHETRSGRALSPAHKRARSAFFPEMSSSMYKNKVWMDKTATMIDFTFRAWQKWGPIWETFGHFKDNWNPKQKIWKTEPLANINFRRKKNVIASPQI